MNDFIEKIYTPIFHNLGFSAIQSNNQFNSAGSCWKLSSDVGEGFYWIYAQKDLFDIKIHDFFFHEDSMLEFELPKCLSITHYESISGEELSPYKRLSPGCIKSYIGGFEPYKVLIHKKIPIRSIGIEILPTYYEGYLREQYPNEYVNPFAAFQQIEQTMDFPEMAHLLHQIKTYRGDGISASLFYESKVAETVSLVLEQQKNKKSQPLKVLSEQDIQQLTLVTVYLNDHYAYDVSLDQLSKIACMGKTKLKSSFKQMHNCTITKYVQLRRINQAEYMLIETNLTVGQIAQTVGYKSASRFSELFYLNTGFLPIEFRKMEQNSTS